MSTDLDRELTILTKELMTKEGIEEYDFHVKGQSEKGGNYLGDVAFFTVLSKGGKIKYNLVMKTIKRSKKMREKLPLESAFKRESFMYRVVFPEMRKFLKSVGNKVNLEYVPKIYLVCDEQRKEALILEDLNYLGYRMWDRKKAMDLKHVLCVLKCMGKHHGICLAMRKKVPNIFEECTKNLTNLFKEFCVNEDITTVYIKLLANACEVIRKSGLEELANKFESKIKNNVNDIIIRETPIEDRLVICHGDCWNNNILFKYKNSHDLSGICFLDYQLSMLDSPVKDLSFFIYTACDKSVLDNFELLLKTYYASLVHTLKVLGCNSGDYFTYEELMYQWKKYAVYGLVLCTFFVKIELLCSEEAPEEGEEPGAFLNPKMKNEDLYNSRIVDVFTHFGKKFL